MNLLYGGIWQHAPIHQGEAGFSFLKGQSGRWVGQKFNRCAPRCDANDRVDYFEVEAEKTVYP
jgi:hypothetical protein